MGKKNKEINKKPQKVNLQLPFKLIDFDQKTRIFLGANIVLFLLLVLFKIHGSSIALWNNKTPEDKKMDEERGLLMGTPRVIRIDEWSRNTPFIFSQFHQGFPKNNSSYGAGNNTLASNMPVKDITTIFRPIFWGFFLFDLEHGYAWYWHFRTFTLIVGFFLLLMLLTRNNFLLSVFGSLWVFSSSATQWWYSAMIPEIISFSSIMFVSAIYVLYSESWRAVALNVLLFVIFSFSFITVLYPPWLIQAGYLFLLLVIGYIAANPIKNILFEKIVKARVGLIAVGMVILAAITGYFYLEIKEFAAILQATVYPGSRKFEGGDITIARLFADYLFFSLKENTIPAEWYNICESSGYILFFPIIIIALAFAFYKRIKIPVIFWLLSGYLLLLTIWALVGMPAFVAKILLLDKISGVRTSSFIGVGSIVLTILFLNESKRFLPLFTSTVKGVFLICTLLFIYWVMVKVNAVFPEKTTSAELFGVAAYFTLIHFCFFTKWKFNEVLFCIALLPFLLPNLLINPISTGLDPILKHPLYVLMSEVKQRYSNGRWIVLGQNSPVVANLLKASGNKVFGGVIVSPNLKQMEVLDEEKKYADIYNRYIDQFNIFPAPKGSQPAFTLNFGDAITLAVDPCYKRLKDLDIRYALFLYNPSQEETQCMQVLDSKYPYPLFAYKDSTSVLSDAPTPVQ